MHIEITYQQTNERYTSYRQCIYNEQPIIFTFTREQQLEESLTIETTAEVLPLAEEGTR